MDTFKGVCVCVGSAIGLLFGAIVLICGGLLAFFAALWPLWLSVAAVGIAGHFIGWW